MLDFKIWELTPVTPYCLWSVKRIIVDYLFHPCSLCAKLFPWPKLLLPDTERSNIYSTSPLNNVRITRVALHLGHEPWRYQICWVTALTILTYKFNLVWSSLRICRSLMLVSITEFMTATTCFHGKFWSVVGEGIILGNCKHGCYIATTNFFGKSWIVVRADIKVPAWFLLQKGLGDGNKVQHLHTKVECVYIWMHDKQHGQMGILWLEGECQKH